MFYLTFRTAFVYCNSLPFVVGRSSALLTLGVPSRSNPVCILKQIQVPLFVYPVKPVLQVLMNSPQTAYVSVESKQAAVSRDTQRPL